MKEKRVNTVVTGDDSMLNENSLRDLLVLVTRYILEKKCALRQLQIFVTCLWGTIREEFAVKEGNCRFGSS